MLPLRPTGITAMISLHLRSGLRFLVMPLRPTPGSLLHQLLHPKSKAGPMTSRRAQLNQSQPHQTPTTASRKSNETEEDEARTNTAADEVAHEATAHSTVAVADSEAEEVKDFVEDEVAHEATVVVDPTSRKSLP
jgi:hypothetical protein